MKKELKCIMLVEDNAHDNFFHEREIRKTTLTTFVLTKNTGKEAIEYIKSKEDPQPDLIFLDINMPVMNGWEFLEEYNLLDKELQCGAIIIMLTTSDNDDDIAKAKAWSFVADYISKPLTKEIMEDIIVKYFY